MPPDTRPQPGYVYVLTNPAYHGLVKIGHTARDPYTRVAELSASSGVPVPFQVAWYHPVIDHEALEGVVHGRLAAYRANRKREFFRCSVQHARHIIEQEAAALLLPWWRAWLHRLAHPVPARPASRRAGRLRRRHSPGDPLGLFIVLAAFALTYVLTIRPSWIPPGVLHLLLRLPQIHPSIAWP